MAFHKFESQELCTDFQEAVQEAIDTIDERLEDIIPEQVVILIKGVNNDLTSSIEGEQCGWIAYYGATTHEIAQDLKDMVS